MASATAGFEVCPVADLPPGERKIVEIDGLSIGVFNVNGRFHALLNRCPHMGGPLCAGLIRGLVVGPEPYKYELEREGEILRCPWHGWEFDITNGRSVFNPHRMRTKSYNVTVEESADDPSVDTFPVTVERRMVVVHVR